MGSDESGRSPETWSSMLPMSSRCLSLKPPVGETRQSIERSLNIMSNTKKLLAKLLVLCMVVGMIPATLLGAAAASSYNDAYYGVEEDTATIFKDVPAGAYYAKAVNWATEMGITNGTSDTTFSPDKECSEDEMMTFLWRAAGSPKTVGAVSGSDYYSQAVQWAKEKGIISGTHGGSDVCDRAEMVVFLWRAAGSPHRIYEHKFTDVDPNADYYPALLWALREGITNGTSDTTFSPEGGCTRAQMVTFLYRAYA